MTKQPDLNAQDSNGNTALHTCAYYSNSSLKTFLDHNEPIQFLVNAGADPGIQNYDGQYPYQVAAVKEIRKSLAAYLSFASEGSCSSSVAKNAATQNIPVYKCNSDTVKKMLNKVTKFMPAPDRMEKPRGELEEDFVEDPSFTTTPKRKKINETKGAAISKITEEEDEEKEGDEAVSQTPVFGNNKRQIEGKKKVEFTNAEPTKSQASTVIARSEEKKTSTTSGGNATTDGSSDDLRSSSCSSMSEADSFGEEKIGPQSFIAHYLLGKGSFGEVYLVEKKNTKQLFAMKILNKNRIMGQNLTKYAMTERNVLSITKHPFIMKLNFAFQTADKLFLILDYAPGGDLSDYITREKRFKEERARIYACEILLALEDLHKRDIIFRDLKPDNVVLDAEGHALLTDFGLSKEGVLDNKGAKSFCGSIAYLAPEMLKRSGHGKSVDWYLYGVLLYEMLVGYPPYYNNSKEIMFENIKRGHLEIPSFISEDSASLIRQLLVRDPLNRLGAGKEDAEEIKKHPFFKKISWEDVSLRKLEPPPPKIKDVGFPIQLSQRVMGSVLVGDDPKNYLPGWSFIQPSK